MSPAIGRGIFAREKRNSFALVEHLRGRFFVGCWHCWWEDMRVHLPIRPPIHPTPTSRSGLNSRQRGLHAGLCLVLQVCRSGTRPAHQREVTEAKQPRTARTHALLGAHHPELPPLSRWSFKAKLMFDKYLFHVKTQRQLWCKAWNKAITFFFAFKYFLL